MHNFTDNYAHTRKLNACVSDCNKSDPGPRFDPGLLLLISDSVFVVRFVGAFVLIGVIFGFRVVLIGTV